MKSFVTVLALLLTQAAYADTSFHELLEGCNERVKNGQGRDEAIKITCYQTRDRWVEVAGKNVNKTEQRKLKYSIGIAISSLKDGSGKSNSGNLFNGQVDDFNVSWSCPEYQRQEVTYQTSVSFTNCRELQARVTDLGIKNNDYVGFCSSYTNDALNQALGRPGAQLGGGFTVQNTCDMVTFCAGEAAPRAQSSCKQE